MDDPDQDGAVRWVASQSPIPALQALIKEAERDKKSRSLSTFVASPDTSVPSSASDPALSSRQNHLPAAHRKLRAASTSSANHPLHVSARSPHLTALSTSNDTYAPQEEEPEAVAFVELLRDAFKKLDENSLKKQRLATRAREKERGLPLAKGRVDNRTGLVTSSLSARPLTKTSSASAICPAGPSKSAPQLVSSTSLSSSLNSEPRGGVLAKTASLGPGAGIISGKCTPASLPSHTLKCDPKPTSRLPARASTMPNALPPPARKTNTPEPTLPDGDSLMQDVIDLTESDSDWEKPLFAPTSRADTTMCVQVDDGDDSDTGMDVSFFQPEPPPQTRALAPKPKPQPPQLNTASHSSASTQRTRTGPPPLGMRRAPLLQPSQFSSSQGSKGATVARFKPPLLTNARGGTANKTVSGTKLAATASSKPPSRNGGGKVAVGTKAAQESRDPDSSFDVSFDMDVDALEEAMKAYD